MTSIIDKLSVKAKNPQRNSRKGACAHHASRHSPGKSQSNLPSISLSIITSKPTNVLTFVFIAFTSHRTLAPPSPSVDGCRRPYPRLRPATDNNIYLFNTQNAPSFSITFRFRFSQKWRPPKPKQKQIAPTAVQATTKTTTTSPKQLTDQDLVTQQQSLTIVKTLLGATFGCVTYLR